MDNLLTPKELSELLQIKLSTVYKWSHYGYVPSVKIGDLLRFRKKRIEEWIKTREKSGRKSYRLNIDT